MLNQNDKIKIIELYNSGNNLTELSKIFHYGVPTIKDVLVSNNIKIRGSHAHHQGSARNTNLENYHRNIIEGLLLGDGSIIRQKRDRTAKLSVKTTEKIFANHIVSCLPLDLSFYSCKPVKSIIRGVECNSKESYKIESKVDNSLNIFRDKWYVNNKKVVPLDLDLSPLSVKYWFFGDGTTSFIRYKNNLKNSVVLVFYTNGFTVLECEFLQEQLFRKIGINFHVNYDRGKPILKISTKEAANKFFDYIGVCDVDCYQYKWKFPVNIENNLNELLD